MFKNTFKNSTEDLIDTCAQIDTIAQQVSLKFSPHLDEYGMELENLSFGSLEVDEQSVEYQQFSANKMARMGKRMDAQGEAQARVITAQGKVSELQTMGEAYTTIKGIEMLQTIAENPGSGGIASAGAGLGMGMAAGTAFGSIAQSIFSGTQQQSQQPKQTGFGGASRFGTGTQESSQSHSMPPSQDPVEVLSKMKVLLEKGLITQDKYDEKVSEILSRM